MQNLARKIHYWIDVLCLLTVPLFAQGETFQLLGFPGTGISAIAIHPNNDSILYVGASRSFFRSIDAGATWDTLLDSLSVTDIVIHPLHPDTIYVNGMGGILKTIDGGTTWTPVNNEFYEAEVETFIQTLAIHTTNPKTLYVGTAGFFGGNLYRSVNGGQSWTKIDTACAEEGIGLYDGVIEVAVDPLHPDTVYAGVNWMGEIYKSTDAGSTWAALNTPWGEGYGLPYTITLNPIQSNIIYTCVYGYGLMKSEDGGITWTHKDSDIDGNATAIQTIVIDQLNPKQMYAGLNAYGVFETTNGGEHWNAINTGLGNLDVSSLVLIEQTLYVGTRDGLYKREHITSVKESKNLPQEFFLSNYPNPFNPITMIEYRVEQPSNVVLSIFNLKGQEIRNLELGRKQAGLYTVQWNGQNNQGELVPSGVYVARLTTTLQNVQQIQSIKMVLVK